MLIKPLTKYHLLLFLFSGFHNLHSQTIPRRSDTSQFAYYRGKIKDITFFMKFDQENPKKYSERGSFKSLMFDYYGALADFNKAIALDSNNAGYYDDRGFLYFDHKKYEAASLDFDKALRLDSTLIITYLNKGQLLMELNKFEEALGIYTKALMKPSQGKEYYTYFNRADAYRRLNRIAEAQSDYDMAIQLKPDFTVAYEERAEMKTLLNDFQGALSDYNKAFGLNGPVLETSYAKRGVLFIKLKTDYKKAVSDFTKAIEMNPYDSESYKNRGETKCYLSDKAGGCADLRTALKMGNASAKDSIKYFCK
jgi:tetratricopeptide (TPR) repeat protein